jgi:outer membrane cobalamin receptor
MYLFTKKNTLILVILCLFAETFAIDSEADRKRLRGSVIDKNTQEILIGATIYVEELKTGTATDVYGNFILRLNEGNYSLKISYIGYKTSSETIELRGDITKTFYLEKDSRTIEDVVISAKISDQNISRTEMSVERMEIQQIRQIPALMGEVDVIKALQLLPGVQATSEGGSGFSVRGGNYDQNLILLDEATVYNASHLMGFFSVFNNDAVKEIELYKGDIPAAYGGRLSSLLKVEIAEGDPNRIHGRGGIGTISSRLTLEGPIIKDKTTFMVACRRSYTELYIPLFAKNNPDLEGAGLYFYDVNAKLKHKINSKNTLTWNYYKGWDEFYQESATFGFGNEASTLSWVHSYNENVATKVSALYSKYNYKTGASLD